MAYGLWQERSLVSSFEFFFLKRKKKLCRKILKGKKKKKGYLESL